jgi:hypothetical protein
VQPVAPSNLIKAPAPVTKLPPVEVAKPAITKPQITNPAATVGKPTLDPALKGTKISPVAVTPVVNPIGDKKFGTGAGSSLDQFSREADMAKITGRSANLLNEAAGKKGPGGTVTQPTDNRITHDFDAGRGTAISKRAQQSSGAGPVPLPYPNAGDSNWRPAVGPTQGGTGEPPARGISNGDEAGTLKGVASTTPKEPKPTSNSSRPAPDSEGGDGGGRVFGEAKEKPSAADIEKTRKRQVGMPSEGGRDFEQIKGDEKLAASAMAKRTGNAIRPAGEDAGQAGVTPGSTNPAGPAGNPNPGNKREPGLPEHGGNCPPDSPTC